MLESDPSDRILEKDIQEAENKSIQMWLAQHEKRETAVAAVE